MSVAGADWNRRDWLIVLGMLVAGLVLFDPYLDWRTTLVPGLPHEDARTQWVCWREFGFRAMGRGCLPLWNPHVLCGVPFLASGQSALFYPPNLIFLLMPLHWAVRVSLLAHFVAGAVCTYLLARRLELGRSASVTAAAIFALSGPHSLRLYAGHWGAVCAITWLPLVFLAVETTLRRRTLGAALWGGVAVAMQILAGAPQYVLYTAMAAGIFALTRIAFRPHAECRGWAGDLARCMLIYLFGAALAAIQLFPILEAAPHSARAGGLRREWASIFAFTPESLVTILAPHYFGDELAIPYWGRWNLWEMSAHVGSAAAVLALVGLFAGPRCQREALGVGALLMLLLALGRHVPLLHDLYRALPGVGMLRGTSKFLSPFVLFIGLLAGMGVDALTQQVAARRAWSKVGLALVLVVLPVIGLLAAALRRSLWRNLVENFLALGERYQPVPADLVERAGDIVARADASVALLFVVALAAVFLLARHNTKVAPWMSSLVAALVAVQLGLWFAHPYLSPRLGFDAYEVAFAEAPARQLAAQRGLGRAALVGAPYLNDAMRLELDVVEGIDPNPPLRFHQLFRRAIGEPLDVAPTWYQMTRSSEVWDLMGLRFVWGGDGGVLDRGFGLRVRLAHDYQVVAEPEARLTAVASGVWRRAVILEREPGPAATAAGPWAGEEYAYIRSCEHNHVVVECGLSAPGFLVLADNWFPGWQVQVNGSRAPLLVADHAFRAVRLDAGRHIVCFQYRPLSFRLGAFVSGLAVSLGLIYFIFSVRRSRALDLRAEL